MKLGLPLNTGIESFGDVLVSAEATPAQTTTIVQAASEYVANPGRSMSGTNLQVKIKTIISKKPGKKSFGVRWRRPCNANI